MFFSYYKGTNKFPIHQIYLAKISTYNKKMLCNDIHLDMAGISHHDLNNIFLTDGILLHHKN